jgi:hypothetical protein
MTLDAHIIEKAAPAEPCAPDPRIARAEMWLCMLGWLADLGAWMVSALAHQAAPGMNEPRWSGPWISFPARVDPSVVYERVSRAVRLALALRMKVKTEIAALRAGKLPSWAAPAREVEWETARLSDKYKDDGCEANDTEREAPERGEPPEGAEAPERPENLEGDLHERLRESDRFYKLLNGSLKEAVAAICLDLGLKADWSQWTEDGFPPPPGGDVRVWGILAPAQCGAPPPPDLPDLNEEADGPAQIIWRPSWSRPRRPKPASPFSGEAMRRWENGLPP